jgi:hypothetical protein
MSDEQFSAENADGAVMNLQGGQVGHDNVHDDLDSDKSEQGTATGRGTRTGGGLADAIAHSRRGCSGLRPCQP